MFYNRRKSGPVEGLYSHVLDEEAGPGFRTRPHDKAWRPNKQLTMDWRRRQREVKKVKQETVPAEFKRYDEQFAKVVSFEQQLASLKERGFLRPYKAYTPPEDLDERFGRVCEAVLADFGRKEDLRAIQLDRESRASLLTALAEEFEGHRVPNSLVHTMTSLDHVLHFYSTAVDVRTPYEKLHDDQGKGLLPPNLTVQRDPKR